MRERETVRVDGERISRREGRQAATRQGRCEGEVGSGGQMGSLAAPCSAGGGDEAYCDGRIRSRPARVFILSLAWYCLDGREAVVRMDARACGRCVGMTAAMCA